MTPPDRLPRLAFIALALLFAVAAAYAALARGPWLDEFWSWHLSDPSLSMSELAARWRIDTHPPLANMLYLMVREVGASGFGMARLLLNGMALAAVTGTLLLLGRRTADPFYPVFGILLLGATGAVIAFSDFRSYFWQITAAAGASAFCYSLLAGQLGRVHGWRLVVGSACILAALWLHYVTTVLMAPLLGWTVAALWLLRRTRAALFLAALTGASLATAGLTAMVQVKAAAGLLDIRWIATSTPEALALYGNVLLRSLVSLAPPLLATLVLARPARLPSWREPRGLFVGVILLAILSGAAAALVANALQPIIIERYLLVWPVLAAAAASAALARAAAIRPLLLAVLVGWSALLLLRGAEAAAHQESWREGMQKAAQLADRCPGTRIYAAPHWRFGPAADSRSAALESPVAMEGYRLLAGNVSAPIRVLDQKTPVWLAPEPRCPTLMLFSNPFAVPSVSADKLLHIGRISLAQPATVRFASQSEQTWIIAIAPAD